MPWLWLLLFPLWLHWPHLSGMLSENPALFTADLLAPGVPHAGILLGQPGFIDGNAGVTLQSLGGLAARDWLAGHVPWWNPDTGLGLPLAAEWQNGAFFLPFVLLLTAGNGIVWLKISLQIFAGLATRGLLAELGLAPVVSLGLALAFEANGSFAWVGHGPMLPVAFLPVLLWGVERARHDAARGAVLVGLGIGFSLLAGFPEVAYLDGLLALALAVTRWGQDGAGLRYPAALGLGLVAGLLLAAPPLLAFAQFLPHAFIGGHGNFGAAVLPRGSRPTLFFPYILGPPMHGGLALRGAASVASYVAWYQRPGYLDLPIAMLAAMAVRPAARDGAARLVLAGFVLLALGRMWGAPLVTPLVNAWPLLPNTMAQLYLVPACQMALTVLAGFTVQDGLSGRLPRAAWLMAAAVALFALACLPGAAAEFKALAGTGFRQGFAGISLSYGLGVGFGAVVLGFFYPAGLAWLLPLEAGILFMVPLLCGLPGGARLDAAGIAALRGLPPLSRSISVGVLAPNYGAWLGVAQADSNYLPVPRTWHDWLARHWAGFDGVNFYPHVTPVDLDRLRKILPALTAHGVGYMAMAAPTDMFQPRIAPALPPAARGLGVAVPLASPLVGSLPAALARAGRAVALRVTLGTYGGRAGGQVMATLCQAGACARGAASLAGARDNAPLVVTLGAGLELRPGLPMTYRLASVPAGDLPPALWMVPRADGTRWPRLGIDLAAAADAPRPIFSDAVMTLFRLSGVTPYWVAPGCTIGAAGATWVRVACPRASVLVRQELDFPGWRVWRAGRWRRTGSDGLVQRVAVPAGVSVLRFRYQPSGADWAMAGSGLGLAMLLALWGRTARSSGRRRMMGRSIV